MPPPDARHWFGLLFASRATLSPGVPARVLVFGVIAVAIVVLDRFGVHVRLPLGLHEVAGAVLALVLAFRTNTAYARFWEGRTQWGSVVNASRNLARVVRVHARLSLPAARSLGAWIALFAHAMRTRLREEKLDAEAARLVPAADALRVCAAPHAAVAVATELSSSVRELARERALDPMMALAAERHLGTLIDALGACERIRNTPTPLGLVVLMERFVAAFLASLPFALVARAGVATPVLVAVIAYPILMIDALGTELDNPFAHDPNDLPLSRICANIEREMLATSAETASDQRMIPEQRE